MTPEPPVSLWPDPDALGTVTDLYQLTMMAGYVAEGRQDDHAVFEMFVRRLPSGRSYLVFAGLEQAIGHLLKLRFSPEQVEGLRILPAFARIDPGFFEGLKHLRFDGDVWAVPEGTVVFPGEPLLRVEARLPVAQWVESFLLASIGYPTLVASKAARVVEAASGRPVYDYGLRRGHGPMAGMLAARAVYLAGGAGTSLVEAAIRLGIPCVGTMAHSWVQAFEDEPTAFRAYARTFPGSTTLLVDTYDVEAGVRHAAEIEPPVQAVRIDSGDPLVNARLARRVLDDRGRQAVRIVASGDLDEWSIAALVAAGAPIDAFGVGTELITSRDAPALSMVYKLVEIQGQGRVKLSPGKRTYPLSKQVMRRRGVDQKFQGDHVVGAGESAAGETLLKPVVRDGRLVAPLPNLEAIRGHCRRQLADLPDDLRGLDASAVYPLSYSETLQEAGAALGLRGG